LPSLPSGRQDLTIILAPAHIAGERYYFGCCQPIDMVFERQLASIEDSWEVTWHGMA